MTSARRRPGSVTVFALTLVALVGMALAAITVRLSATAHQAAEARHSAQVQQLILAGIEVARRGIATGEVALPDVLAAGGGKLSVKRDGARVIIETELHGARGRQVVEISGGVVKLVGEE